jgi:hypothetical protein
VCTPPAIGNGSWDVKVVLGEATVHADGSAFFTLPARTPAYFQAIDAQGRAVQTMRSWLTLQPGENASCVGCHESKNSVPPADIQSSLALQAGPQDLAPFHGPPRGFSFAREIQPILDRHCVRCHQDEQKWKERIKHVTASTPLPSNAEMAAGKTAFSLLGTPMTEDLAKRQWSVSYLALVQATERGLEGNRYLAGTATPLVNWVSAQSEPGMLPPYAAGSTKSRLLSLLTEHPPDDCLSPDELEILACWIDLLVPFCGDYLEANHWTLEERQKYNQFQEKRRRMEELERRNIAEWINFQKTAAPASDLKLPGSTTTTPRE